MDNVTERIQKKVKLEDMIPENSEVRINGKMYAIRKITIEDEAFISRLGNIQNAFAKEDFGFMAKLVFRLMVDKSEFQPIEIEQWDDDGISKTKRILSGPDRILQGLCGPQDKIQFIAGLMVTIGLSRPVFESIMNGEMEIVEKKTLNPIGETSSTP